MPSHGGHNGILPEGPRVPLPATRSIPHFGDGGVRGTG
jgi:hypothetical protein